MYQQHMQPGATPTHQKHHNSQSPPSHDHVQLMMNGGFQLGNVVMGSNVAFSGQPNGSSVQQLQTSATMHGSTQQSLSQSQTSTANQMHHLQMHGNIQPASMLVMGNGQNNGAQFRNSLGNVQGTGANAMPSSIFQMPA